MIARLTILLLFISFIASSVIWLIKNNGTLEITWLNYYFQTDITTVFIIISLLLVIILSFFLVLNRVKKVGEKIRKLLSSNPLKEKDKIIENYKEAVNLLIECLIQLNAENLKQSIHYKEKIFTLIKHDRLNLLLNGKIHYLKEEYNKASNIFANISNSKEAKIVSLKSSINLKNNSITKNIQLIEKILLHNKKDNKISVLLFSLHMKNKNYLKANQVRKTYKISKYLNFKKDIIFLKKELIKNLYRQRKIIKCLIKSYKMRKFEDKQIIKIYVLSCIRLGLRFLAIRKIKKQLKNQPSLKKIYLFIYRDISHEKQIDKLKTISKINEKNIF